MGKAENEGVGCGSYTASMVVVCHCTDNHRSSRGTLQPDRR